MATNTTDRSLKTTIMTFKVVELLKAREGAGVTEVADELGIAPSTAHNHLSTLEAQQYVVKEGDTYHLGLRFIGLGNFVRTRKQGFGKAEHYTTVLSEESECRSIFTAEEHGRGVYIHTAPGKHGVWTQSTVGKRIYLHSTASGKAILAHMPRERVEEIVEQVGLPRETEQTIDDQADLFAELETIRERGYATNVEEQIEGVRAIGAPVLQPDGSVFGALSVAGPSNRMKGDRFDELTEILLGIANELELSIALS
ncbi:IclR family transcriptional regulator [Halogranum rubrum]|uniref:IclR family transcriptional regulator n=1 Tax=Halogranum rubrum TaxID=553466 RepID=UPI000677ABCD|nr:IclR family transcriptional regulator [Halogranum salarium]